MKYPSGRVIQISDKIWWNEGSNVGRVALILENEQDFANLSLSYPGKETQEQLDSYGPSEKGIFICASLDSEDLSTDVFCSEEDFEDEGIDIYDIG